MPNARAEIGNDGVEIGQVGHGPAKIGARAADAGSTTNTSWVSVGAERALSAVVGFGALCTARTRAYLAILVEIPQAGGVRMVGNLLGDPLQNVVIGADVVGVFEHHADSDPAYSLLQWRVRGLDSV